MCCSRSKRQHWRARTVDAAGAASGWVGYGLNSEDSADFVISVDDNLNAPDPPSTLTQLRRGGADPIAVGETVAESALVFQALVNDPERNTVRIQIEYKPVGVAFDGTVTVESPTPIELTPDGFEATYVADETQRYRMGYCQSQRGEPWLGDYFPGVSITLPFAFSVPEPKR